MKYVHTANGLLDPDELGITLTHEHILTNGLSWKVQPKEPHHVALSEKSKNAIDMRFLDALRRGPHFSDYNLVLDDHDLMVEELEYFWRAGGRAVVDVTGRGMDGMERDVFARNVKSICDRARIHLIISTGFYLDKTHPSLVRKKNVANLRGIMVKDILSGIPNTGIRAGIIGEIGITTCGMTPSEEKVLRAAAQAQTETEACLVIHTWGSSREETQASKVSEVLEEEGVDFRRVVMAHMEFPRNLEYVKWFAERGGYVGIDCFGAEFPMMFDTYGVVSPTDYERALCIRKLIEAGYLDRILISHDIGLKMDLKRYGGWGYEHILVNIPRVFEKAGIGKQEFKTIIEQNPKEMLAF